VAVFVIDIVDVRDAVVVVVPDLDAVTDRVPDRVIVFVTDFDAVCVAVTVCVGVPV